MKRTVPLSLFAASIALTGCIFGGGAADNAGTEDASFPTPDASSMPDAADPKDGSADATNTGTDVGSADTGPDLALDMRTKADAGPSVTCAELGPPAALWDMESENQGIIPVRGSAAEQFEGLSRGTAPIILGPVTGGSYLGFPPRDKPEPFIPHSEGWNIEEGTLSVWISPTPDLLMRQEPAGIISRDASGLENPGHFHLELDQGRLRARFQTSDGDLNLFDGGRVQGGTWTHVAVLWSMKGLKLFRNGIEVVSNGTGASLAGNQNPVGVGFSTAGSTEGDYQPGREYYLGGIDDISVWDRALTADEVRRLAEPTCRVSDNI